MTSDDGGDTPVIVGRPLVEAFVHFIAQTWVRGGAGGIFHAGPLQIRPDMIDEELAHGSDGAAAHGVGLMAVDHEDGIVQDDSFVDLNPRKQELVDVLMILPIEVVIPPDLNIAGLRGIGVVEFRQEFIDRRMGDVYLVKVLILPEFFGIAQFDVRKAVFEIVFQSTTVDQGVLGEVIGAGTVTPVHVGHDDQLHAGGHGDVLDPFKFGEIAHMFLPPLGFAFGLHLWLSIQYYPGKMVTRLWEMYLLSGRRSRHPQ